MLIIYIIYVINQLELVSVEEFQYSSESANNVFIGVWLPMKLVYSTSEIDGYSSS